MPKSPDFTMEMVCCEITILNEIKQKECKRKDIALTYYFCMVSKEDIDWEKINKAIIKRWSFSGLEYIKKEAYEWAEKKWEAREIGGGIDDSNKNKKG